MRTGEIFSLRASVRGYKPEPIPPEVTRDLLNAAIEAPSAGNCQPWHFYAVTNPDLKEKLCDGAHRQNSLVTAPLIIVVCMEKDRLAARFGERGETLYCIQDTAAAIENILLSAVEHGLATCWCGAFDEAEIAAAMELPAARRPVALLAVGYPDAPAKKPARRPFDETVTFLE
jgi:nitroreductase